MKQLEYTVRDTDTRDFRNTRKIKNLYIFNSVIAGAFSAFLITALPDLLSRTEGLAEAEEALGFTAIGAIIAIIFMFLLFLTMAITLSQCIKKDLNKPVIVISIISIVLYTVSIITAIFTIIENLTNGGGAPYQGAGAAAIAFWAIPTSYLSYKEGKKFMPGTSIFKNGVRVSTMKSREVSQVSEMLHESQVEHGDVSGSDFLSEIAAGTESQATFRVARVDGQIAGYLMMSADYKQIGQMCIYSSPYAKEIASNLVQDFARVYSRSMKPVSAISVPFAFESLQASLSQNGWTAKAEDSKSKTILFEYTGEVLPES